MLNLSKMIGIWFVNNWFITVICFVGITLYGIFVWLSRLGNFSFVDWNLFMLVDLYY